MISRSDRLEGHGHPRRISHKSLAARTHAINPDSDSHTRARAITRTSKIVSSTAGRLRNADVPLNRTRIDADEGRERTFEVAVAARECIREIARERTITRAPRWNRFNYPRRAHHLPVLVRAIPCGMTFASFTIDR